LHDLLKSLQSTVERPSILPKWNVFLVLHALKALPFEPLRFASLRSLTWKTLFLVSLAACRRISEMHAFLHDMVDYNTDGSVTLWTDPVFVAKNQMPGEDFPPTIIHSLSRTLSADNSDRLLCPVRALKYYLERTRNRRRGKKRLFISYTNQAGDVTKNALSRWIAATIKLTYEMSPDIVLQNFSVRPHEIRAISASLNFHDSMDIYKVLNAGVWKGRHTFDRFYFRDMAVGPDGTRRIQSVIAAQQVVSVRRATRGGRPLFRPSPSVCRSGDG
jgi:hypothetical protein